MKAYYCSVLSLLFHSFRSLFLLILYFNMLLITFFIVPLLNVHCDVIKKKVMVLVFM